MAVERVAVVDSDNAGAAAQAVRVLLEAGRRRIATIAGPRDMRAGHDRLEGWRRELGAAGLEQPGRLRRLHRGQRGVA